MMPGYEMLGMSKTETLFYQQNNLSGSSTLKLHVASLLQLTKKQGVMSVFNMKI